MKRKRGSLHARSSVRFRATGIPSEVQTERGKLASARRRFVSDTSSNRMLCTNCRSPRSLIPDVYVYVTSKADIFAAYFAVVRMDFCFPFCAKYLCPVCHPSTGSFQSYVTAHDNLRAWIIIGKEKFPTDLQ